MTFILSKDHTFTVLKINKNNNVNSAIMAILNFF